MAVGAASSVALAMASSGTLSAITARIQNSANSAGVGTLTMTETLLDAAGQPTSTLCMSNTGTASSMASNSATCSTINKYGGATASLTPGGASQTTQVSIGATGTEAAATFTLAPGACTATPGAIASGTATSADVCGAILVSIVSGPTTIYSGPAASMPASINLLSKLGRTSVSAGSSITFSFTVSLTGSADATYQGFTVSQPLTWSFTT